jgi:hypothetical protein
VTFYFIVSPKDLSVFAQLRVTVPVDEACPGMIAQGIHYQTRLREIGFALRNLPLGKDDLEVFAYLFKQLTLQICYVATQRRNLIYRAVALEVRHKLYHGLQELGAFAVLSSTSAAASTPS